MVLLPLQNPPALPFLSPALGSHMVMQRGRPNAFWGWTSPGEKVTVSVGGKKAVGAAGPDGKWLVRIDPPKVGGPYTVAIDGSQHVELTDVLVGDVWLCTGQSNMEMGVGAGVNGGAEMIAGANDPQMRLFLVPHQVALTPQKTVGGAWQVCTPETVAQGGWSGFSAVGYSFGKALRREVGVPIGLVGDYWGGTNAESWMSREAVRELQDFDPALASIDASLRGGTMPYAKQVEDWYVVNDPGTKERWETGPAGPLWKPVEVPSGFDGLGLADFDGTAWFRRDVELTAAQASGEATLRLGAIDDADATWINGKLVGGTTAYDAPRVYKIAAGTLVEGHNAIAVRVLDTGMTGGFSGPAGELSLTLADGTKIPLGGTWQGRVGADFKKASPYPADTSNNPNIPTSLSNGMIEPLVPLAIKGAIWYQGENNSGRAYQYRRVLPAMINDWRRRFGQGDFPFYIVSLAAFQPHKDAPGDDEWAELREAQAMTAKGVKNAGLALAIDIGDAADIHPKEKKTVGERLALIALAKDYGQKVAYSGPTYRSFSVKGSEAWVRFDHTDGGLLARGGPLGEFAVAGVDRKWHWATARIEGDAVVVSSPEVSRPVAVRYAWQSNPIASLSNGAGLPAVPFRTDDWPGITVARK